MVTPFRARCYAIQGFGQVSPGDRLAAINVVRAILGVVPGDGRGQGRAPDRSWRPGSRASAARSEGSRRSCRTSRRPGRRPRLRPAKKTVWTLPQWSRPGSLYAWGSVEIRGVRPNSPAITISVDSSRPLAFRSSSKRREGLVGRREELLLQMREHVAVRIPGLVVAEVDLHQVDTRPRPVGGPSAATSRRHGGRSGRAPSARRRVRRRLPGPWRRSATRARPGGAVERLASGPEVERRRADDRWIAAARGGPRAGRAAKSSGNPRLGAWNRLAPRGPIGRSWWSNS